ncbi:MAG: hypothetical protein GX088_02035 [Clostridia bacterium]|nr:hypothetical protein [Clostridia bacterium]
MCQNGIDYRGLELAVEQLFQRENGLRKEILAWADYFLEMGAADIAASLRCAVENLAKAGEKLAKAKHQLEHLHHHHAGEHDHHHHHVTVTEFSG